jgi:hypothetical protein
VAASSWWLPTPLDPCPPEWVQLADRVKDQLGGHADGHGLARDPAGVGVDDVRLVDPDQVETSAKPASPAASPPTATILCAVVPSAATPKSAHHG